MYIYFEAYKQYTLSNHNTEMDPFMDPFMTVENANYLGHVLGMASSSRGPLHDEMFRQFDAHLPTGITAEARLSELNNRVLHTFRRQQMRAPPSSPSSRVDRSIFAVPEHSKYGSRERAPEDDVLDETIVVVSAGDCEPWTDAGSTQTSRDDASLIIYEFSIRLDTDPSATGLTLDGAVRNCISVEPISAFIPVSAGLSDEPFLVLATDMPSRNRLVSTQQRLNGMNVVMVTTDDHTSKYDQYTNLTGTALRPTEPQLRLSTMKLRLLLSDGNPFVPTLSSSPEMPRLILRIISRVPRSR